MRRRSRAALIAAAVLLAWGGRATTPVPGYVGTWVWHGEGRDFGGWSGFEISDDGTAFTALSDRGHWTSGRLRRGTDGRIAGVEAGSVRALGPTPGEQGRDSEGLAIGRDGTAYVSFEGEARVQRYAALDEPGTLLPVPREFHGMQVNSSLEALAIGPDGALYTLPERSGAAQRAFPVFRFRDGRWTVPFRIARRGEFLAVGADIGPDGRFYLLERRFMGIGGFASRVRSFAMTAAGLDDERVEMESIGGQHDNLEGIGVWRDAGGGVRMTMVSDDNFFWAQRTELVEYRVIR